VTGGITIGTLWQSPAEHLSLGGDEVHVWRVKLDRLEARLQELLLTLAEDERSRAGRFYFQRDRDRYVAVRGSLRALLSSYLNRKPGELRFHYGAHGKPALANGSTDDSICFNVSYSDEMALLAFSRGREIGVDIERIRTELAREKIAERFFSLREVDSLFSLPPDTQTEAFFNCWTRKEAYIKARGEGLSLPLETFTVSLVPGEPAALLSTAEPSGWCLRELTPDPSYAAALAVEGYDWQLKCWKS